MLDCHSCCMFLDFYFGMISLDHYGILRLSNDRNETAFFDRSKTFDSLKDKFMKSVKKTN